MHVGKTVLLPALDTSPQALATVSKVIDPAQAADQSTPMTGGRFVAVQLRMTFGGRLPISLDPTGDVLLDDAQGNLYVPIDTTIANCPAFNFGATISPGSTVVGCVTFQLATNATVSEITFTPGGQFGSVSAEWLVP